MVVNQLKTVVLLGLLTAWLLWVGHALGGTFGLAIAFVFAIVMNFGSYWFSDRMVLSMYRAKQVADSSHVLHQVVKEVSEKAKLPMPKVYIIPSEQANAFATGRNPKHAAVAATQGILNILSRDELKGVMAHEMAHVKNRDILISTIAGTIAGVISFVANMAQFAAIFGMGRDNGHQNLISLIALAIITPIIATIIQLAISRSREYLADSTGAGIVQDSESLASALEKLHQDVKRHPMRQGSQATAHLFIANPFRGRSFSALLSTHPPMEERVKRLRNMKF